MNPEHIARVVHEANRAYCATLGDNSQPEWRDASDHIRDSKLKGIEFILANPNAPASAQHDSWWQVKRDAGWTFGPVNDASKQEHPCCVPYDELPLEQQRKDDLFRAIVLSLSGVPLFTASALLLTSINSSDSGTTVVAAHDAGDGVGQRGGDGCSGLDAPPADAPPADSVADETPEQVKEVAETPKSADTESPADPAPETPSDEEPLV